MAMREPEASCERPRVEGWRASWTVFGKRDPHLKQGRDLPFSSDDSRPARFRERP
jgi:hypothetical protein